jgi:hypothetical protein
LFLNFYSDSFGLFSFWQSYCQHTIFADRINSCSINLPRYDTGFANPTGFFIDLFKAEIPIIANITNLDKLPEGGFTLVVLPLKITGICTCPARVIAIIESKIK